MKAQNVGLENAIDFGDWLKWLAMPLLVALKFLYGYVHNYGIAIIILTILIKLIFWPLGNKSYKSMKEMQKLQPKMAALREKYKDDKTKLSQESMALYKTHKVNPLGGCLPMVVQIPVFFGLYKSLLYAIELRHSPFFWWIQDLSAKDPYYITPIIMGATMFIQQKMTPTGADPMQAKIMLFMPIIFTFMFLNFPSGLVIYWLFNNIISIGQQVYINRQPA
jgi:YidC/Oxa1 family membrane protein insertase